MKKRIISILLCFSLFGGMFFGLNRNVYAEEDDSDPTGAALEVMAEETEEEQPEAASEEQKKAP